MDNAKRMTSEALNLHFLLFNSNFELFLTKENGLYYPLKVRPQSNSSKIEVGMEFEANVSNSNKSFAFKVVDCLNNHFLAFHWNKENDETLEFLNTELLTLEKIYSIEEQLSPELQKLIPCIRRNSYKIPYVSHKENQYIYPFRPEKDRNSKVYHIDAQSEKLYESPLCKTIKLLKRTKERTSGDSAFIDFGAIRYVIPSHFGFCLGVQNAIERAYEALTLNPGKRVFMLSDLIHNPFVNEDLNRRGLRYLQTDKGVPVTDPNTGKEMWESINRDDVIIIPAFGATDEDKARLIEKGIPFTQYDATCMLVEKVWKAARRFGNQGYTIVIHGKAEHEETRTTFSNATKAAPAVIIRNLKEAEALIAVINEEDPAEKEILFQPFRSNASQGFDVHKDLDRIAVVNQTTLLRNETLEIISRLEENFASKYGKENVVEHISKQQDTLCYATQVNQDALTHALGRGINFAIIVGGKNSSNTYQLFRICEDKLGERVAYIQSEEDIISLEEIMHYIFISQPGNPEQGKLVKRNFLTPRDEPFNILVTGGASCPDGLIQQVISRINSFYPDTCLRSIDEVLKDFED